MPKSINTTKHNIYVMAPIIAFTSWHNEEVGIAVGIVCTRVWGLFGNSYRITKMLANPGDGSSVTMINLQLYIEIMRLRVGEWGRGKSRVVLGNWRSGQNGSGQDPADAQETTRDLRHSGRSKDSNVRTTVPGVCMETMNSLHFLLKLSFLIQWKARYLQLR